MTRKHYIYVYKCYVCVELEKIAVTKLVITFLTHMPPLFKDLLVVWQTNKIFTKMFSLCFSTRFIAFGKLL